MGMHVSAMLTCDGCGKNFGTTGDLCRPYGSEGDEFVVVNVVEFAPWNTAYLGVVTCSDECRARVRVREVR